MIHEALLSMMGSHRLMGVTAPLAALTLGSLVGVGEGRLTTQAAGVWVRTIQAAQENERDQLAQALKALQVGKTATAREQLEALSQSPRVHQDSDLAAEVARAQAICLRAQGELDEAMRILEEAIKAAPANPDLLALLADLEFSRGRWEAAAERTAQARAQDDNHLLARWVDAQLLRETGKLEDAVNACRWFVDLQNEQAERLKTDPEALLLVGQAAELYFRAEARGEDLAQSLNDVINVIYEQAITTDRHCWQAAWLEGRLFLAGYNERLAMPELQRALTINPLAPEVLTTLGQADLNGYKLAAGREKAQRALEINPNYLPAYVLLADLNISDERFADALKAAESALAINPRDQDALARYAAAQRLLLNDAAARAAELAVLADNPRPARFYAALGERLADRRKYPEAERAFLKAVEADPNQTDAIIGLGMLHMQVGREAEAKTLFDQAFAADPFNVRADNMMKVLRHLSGYTTIETNHFRVLVDPAQDELLGRYMADYLEEVLVELSQTLGFTPPGQTQVEILKNHQWFSGRTIGLPFIPTVGACTGKVVAMASPRATQRPYNWARVLKHEMVHVLNLQQTEFNIPHWYTEALAVNSEGYPRPQEWNKMLLVRVPARKLLNLDTINLGFIRPSEPEERQLAYCQAQLYAQYMTQRFGPQAHIRLLDAYRRGLTTDQAIPDAFGIPKEDFEAGYLDFLDAEVRTLKARVESEEPITFSKLQDRLKADPENADLNAKMAYEHFSRRDLREARPFADKALKLNPKQPLAAYVKARLLETIGDEEAARAVLKPALDPENPNERVVDLLGQLEMKAGNLDEAERLFETARRLDPSNSKWIAGLARVHLRQKRVDAFLEDLAKLALNDADDLTLRKELAKRHLQRGEFDQAARWGKECLYIDVYDPECHELLADAHLGQNQADRAVAEYKVALQLQPKKPALLGVKLARAEWAAGQRDEARQRLDAILQADPTLPEAQDLDREWRGKAER